jgi:hypothetical protein
MGLIDVDETIMAIMKLVGVGSERYLFPSEREIVEVIEKMPTVDAIPVEWIKSQVDKGKWVELVQRWAERKR